MVPNTCLQPSEAYLYFWSVYSWELGDVVFLKEIIDEGRKKGVIWHIMGLMFSLLLFLFLSQVFCKLIDKSFKSKKTMIVGQDGECRKSCYDERKHIPCDS